VIFVLSRIGLVTPRFLVRNFKYAVLAAFVISAIITPTPDIVTQSLLALPMIGLYLLGVAVAWLFGRPRQAPVSAEARTPAASPE
jgi:sec-independent protein translocase protein TatC